MFVTTLEITYFQDNVHDSKMVASPTWEQTATAIQSLNGEKYDSVLLPGPGESYMAIAGGDEQRFVVGGFLQESGSFLLSLETGNKGPFAITIGGQECEYAADEVVDLAVATAVAKTFFEQGKCDPRFKWKSRPTQE